MENELEHNTQLRCPALAFFDDPESWISAPSERNCCHRTKSPEIVSEEYQRRVCLNGKFEECRVYQNAPKKLPSSIRHDKAHRSPIRWGILGIGSIVLSLGFFIIFAYLNMQGPREVANERIPVSPIVTQAINTEFTPLASTLDQNNNSAHDEDLTSIHTSVFVSETARLAYNSNLRSGPGTDYSPLSSLEAGTTLFLAGITPTGEWVLVRLGDGQTGWIARSQFPLSLDVSNLNRVSDFSPVNVTPTVDAEITPQPGSYTQPVTPDIDLRFFIELALSDNNICGANYGSFPHEHEFIIKGNSIDIYDLTQDFNPQGTYDHRTNTFEASTNTRGGGTLIYRGQIDFNGTFARISGERIFIFNSPSLPCDGLWLMEGQTQINRP